MSEEGPTTVGSINAKLVLDADEFERRMAEAGREADKLDGRKLEIKADVDAAKALGQLEALQVAANRIKIAQLDLDAVNRKSNATEQEKLRAQNALLNAGNAYEALVRRQRAALEDNSEATSENTKRKLEGVSAMQMLIALSPAALGGTAALAAAASALGAGFVGMGIAGVMAIKGIKDEMDAGTAAGDQYRAGLLTLSGDLDSLGHTAAVSMLRSFLGAVDDINDKMPVLNRLTGDMSSALGNVAGGALQALLTGLERAEPLLDDGALYLARFVSWLDQFASAQGFQDFLAYADSNLPRVTGLLEDLVTLGGRLLASLAPLGPVVIDSLGALANILNSLPLPVLAVAYGLGPTGSRVAVACGHMGISEHYTAAELAQLLKVDPKLVRAKARSGEWPAMILGPRTIRFSEADYEAIRELTRVEKPVPRTRSETIARRERVRKLLKGG